MAANAAGDYFPVLGICLGSQTITSIVAGRSRLSSTPGTSDISLPLEFTSDVSNSRLLGDTCLPSDLKTSLASENITYNTHNFGIRADKFTSDPNLRDFFTVLSTNKDSNGKDFVSTYEGKTMPVYGTQWHPEKAIFDWNPDKQINHSSSAIRAAQHVANFFVEESRKSSHVFGSGEGKAVIQAYPRMYFTDGTFTENFYFNFTTRQMSIKDDL